MKKTNSLFTTIQTITLSNDEKASLRKAVSSYIKEHPYKVSNQQDIVHTYDEVSIIFPYFSRLSFKQYVTVLSVTLVVLISTGTSFAASKALPGDLLYPVKIQVNEPLEIAVASTPEKKANIATKHALRRLDEANVLLREGKLSIAMTEEIKSTFTKKVENANEAIGKLTLSHDYEQAARTHKALEDGIRTRYTVLLVHSDDSEKAHSSDENEHASPLILSATTSPQESLITVVKENTTRVKQRAKDREAQFVSSIVSKPSEDIKELTLLQLSKIANNSRETQEYITRELSASTTLLVRMETEKKLLEATNMYQDAQTKYAQGEYASALSLLQTTEVILAQVRQFADVGTHSRSGFKTLLNDDKEEQIMLQKNISNNEHSTTSSHQEKNSHQDIKKNHRADTEINLRMKKSEN